MCSNKNTKPALLLILGLAAPFATTLRAQVVDPAIIMDLPDYSMQPNSTASFDLFVQNTGSARTVNGIGVYLEMGSADQPSAQSMFSPERSLAR